MTAELAYAVLARAGSGACGLPLALPDHLAPIAQSPRLDDGVGSSY
jgi:hypothetical protein